MTSVHSNLEANGQRFGQVLITVDPAAGDCVFKSTAPFKSNRRVHLHSLDEIRAAYQTHRGLSVTNELSGDIARALKFAGQLIKQHQEGKKP